MCQCQTGYIPNFLSDIKVRIKEKVHNWADHLLFLHSDDIIRSFEPNGRLLNKLAILFS